MKRKKNYSLTQINPQSNWSLLSHQTYNVRVPLQRVFRSEISLPFGIDRSDCALG